MDSADKGRLSVRFDWRRQIILETEGRESMYRSTQDVICHVHARIYPHKARLLKPIERDYAVKRLEKEVGCR